MTITAPAPPAPADRVKQLLVEGKTTQQAAELTGWPRPRVVALVNAVHGWLLDPQKDTVYQPGNAGMVPRLPDGTPPAPDHGEAPAPTAPAKRPIQQDSLADLMTQAAELDDASVRREHRKTLEAIARLRQAVATVNHRLEAEQARQEKIRVTLGTIEVLEKQLAQAKAEAKQLGARRKPAAPTAPATTAQTGPPLANATTQDIRAWADSAGVPCSAFGKIPAPVREQYDRAHPTGDTPCPT